VDYSSFHLILLTPVNKHICIYYETNCNYKLQLKYWTQQQRTTTHRPECMYRIRKVLGTIAVRGSLSSLGFMAGCAAAGSREPHVHFYKLSELFDIGTENTRL
jgi:hypothetical protein